MNFDKECSEEIEAMQEDETFQKTSVAWQLMANEHKYSYHFKWMGLPFIQMPQDIVAIQEVIWEEKPDFVIETGVARGGGVVFYASLLEAMGHGYVIGIDIDIREQNRLAIEAHQLFKRIILLEGSSTNEVIVESVKGLCEGYLGEKVVVILDSLHTHAHVLKELELYSKIADYIIVLDTIIEFMPEFPDRPWGKGNNPYTAVQTFLKNNDEFEVDERYEKLMISTAPSGYLKRVK